MSQTEAAKLVTARTKKRGCEADHRKPGPKLPSRLLKVQAEAAIQINASTQNRNPTANAKLTTARQSRSSKADHCRYKEVTPPSRRLHAKLKLQG